MKFDDCDLSFRQHFLIPEDKFMLPASSRSISNPYSAFPTTQVASAPASAASRTDSGTTGWAPGFVFPLFPNSEAAYGPFEDFCRNGTVPEDKYVQAGIVKTYLKNKDVDGLNEFLEKGNIKSLNLKARSIDCKNAEVLANLIKVNKTLLEIDLSDNQIGADGLKIICVAMEENSTLIALNVGESDPKGSLHVDAIGKMIANNQTLKMLNVSFSNIGEEGMPILAEALKENHTLTELNLAFNHCGSRGMAALSEMLKKNSTLKVLNVSGNLIGSESSGLIADTLKTNTTLKELDLDFNQLGSEGAIPILKALDRNTTLQTLHLASNRLDKASAEHIGSLLQKNITLSSLDLHGNQLFVPSNTADVEAIDAVVRGLEGNIVVTDLDLKGNHPIDQSIVGRPAMLGPWGGRQRDEDIGRIDDLLKRNRTFDALAQRDAGLCASLIPGHLLCPDEGKLLAGAMIVAASSTEAYEAMMVQIQCAINVLASQT